MSDAITPPATEAGSTVTLPEATTLPLVVGKKATKRTRATLRRPGKEPQTVQVSVEVHLVMPPAGITVPAPLPMAPVEPVPVVAVPVPLPPAPDPLPVLPSPDPDPQPAPPVGNSPAPPPVGPAFGPKGQKVNSFLNVFGFELISNIEHAWKFGSTWFILFLGSAGDINNWLVASDFFHGKPTPPNLVSILRIAGATGVLIRILKKKKADQN